MAFGPNPVVGIISLAVIKLAGYSFYGHRLNKYYSDYPVKALYFGVVRTLVGLVVGFLAASIFLQLLNTGLAVFLLLLIPIRFGEWWIVISLCYKNISKEKQRFSIQSFIGIIWSFVLDIPVIASLFVIPGAMWIC